MFRTSFNDMKKIEIYNMDSKDEIPYRRILFKKSLVIDTNMYAIQAA